MVKAFFIGNTSDKKNIDWALKLGANVIFTGHKNLKALETLLGRLRNFQDTSDGGPFDFSQAFGSEVFDSEAQTRGAQARRGKLPSSEVGKVNLYIEFGLFGGEELWKKYPDCRPVDEEGNLAPKIHWYHGVCPNHPEVRKKKLRLIKSIIEDYNVNGIWLDSIRYPCHWEVLKPDLTEYCFCPICLEKFQKETGFKMFPRIVKTKDTSDGVLDRRSELLRGGETSKKWVNWKCDQITNFVADVRGLIDRSGKDVKLGMFSVPWKEADFNGAIKKIIGQDFKRLAKYVDVFSPMVYHKMCGRTTEWIHEIVAYMDKMAGKPILPIIQTEDKPKKITKKEFTQEVRAAIKKPSQGMIIFFLEDLLKDKDKVKVMSSS